MNNAEIVQPEVVLSFWFDELQPENWFKKDTSLDIDIARRFGPTHLALAGNIPDAWRASADTVLALVIVLDQFPRNIYRGTPLAFATDGLALKEARAAIGANLDQLVAERQRLFFYMPFEHSESLDDQQRAVELFTGLGDAELLKYAHMHHDVIAEFGRFPHRNPILGRESSPEEVAYLARPGAGF